MKLKSMEEPSTSHRGSNALFSTPVSWQACMNGMKRELIRFLVLQVTYGTSMGLIAAGEDRFGIISSKKVYPNYVLLILRM